MDRFHESAEETFAYCRSALADLARLNQSAGHIRQTIIATRKAIDETSAAMAWTRGLPANVPRPDAASMHARDELPEPFLNGSRLL
jgi:hypothetical protein